MAYKRGNYVIENLKMGFIMAAIGGLIVLANECAGQEIKVGDTVTIDNVLITKIEGQTEYGYTEIKYLLPNYMVAEMQKRAEDEMWDVTKTNQRVTWAKGVKGGKLTMEIGRLTIESANTKWFTIIVKKDGREIHRETLDDEVAEVPSSNRFWWNLGTVYVKAPVELPFDVYIIESGGTPPKFHFRILRP